MSHYFDDILHRHVQHTGAQTPKSPLLSPTSVRLRRSSTSRSLAARSDFSVTSDDGDEEEHHHRPPHHRNGQHGHGHRRNGSGSSYGGPLFPSVNGQHYDGGVGGGPVGLGVTNGGGGGGGGYGHHYHRSTSSFDATRARERAEADAHLHAYITQQLERVRQERSVDGVLEDGDEFEAQASE
jgi:hypothetical protein